MWQRSALFCTFCPFKRSDKQTKNLIEELDRFVPKRDKHLVIESRATNVIASALNLIDLLEESFSPEESEELTRRLILGIKNRSPDKFKRKIREYKQNEDKKHV